MCPTKHLPDFSSLNNFPSALVGCVYTCVVAMLTMWKSIHIYTIHEVCISVVCYHTMATTLPSSLSNWSVIIIQWSLVSGLYTFDNVFWSVLISIRQMITIIITIAGISLI